MIKSPSPPAGGFFIFAFDFSLSARGPLPLLSWSDLSRGYDLKNTAHEN